MADDDFRKGLINMRNGRKDVNLEIKIEQFAKTAH